MNELTRNEKMDAAVLALSSALGDTKYHPGAPSAKGRGRKFANYEDIVEAGAQAIIGMSKEIAARNVVLGRAAKFIVDMGARLTTLRTALEEAITEIEYQASHTINDTIPKIKIKKLSAVLSATPPPAPDTTAIVEAAQNLMAGPRSLTAYADLDRAIEAHDKTQKKAPHDERDGAN